PLSLSLGLYTLQNRRGQESQSQGHSDSFSLCGGQQELLAAENAIGLETLHEDGHSLSLSHLLSPLLPPSPRVAIDTFSFLFNVWVPFAKWPSHTSCASFPTLSPSDERPTLFRNALLDVAR